IIGSRRLTQDFNLEGRPFLNSHDYRLDFTGAKLERIMNGPLAVGQWINGEHYFTATDPEVYGSGSKIYHNVVGRFAVMSGPQSDLRTGLAWQTVMRGGDQAYHQPMRLLVAAEAPRDRVLRIIERSDLLTKLFDNEWMHLVVIDPESDDLMYRYIPKQGFETIPA
ncbi:MAG: putative inorganic carbon transporter subunit DabA, partial [Desulfobacterales bacterium]